MIVNKIRADTDLASGVQAERLGRLFAESDQSAHLFEVHVMDGAHAVSLDGAAVTGYFIRPDDATVTIQGSASGNVAYLTLPASCYRYAGHFSLIIKVSANDVSTAIFWGDGMITRSTSDILLDPENVVPNLDQLLAQIEAIKQATTNANSALQRAEQAQATAAQAAQRADTAAGIANEAAESASDAANAATAAAESASDAADEASEAAQQVTEAIIPVFTVTATEVAPGQSAATITGTAKNPVLNLSLARGNDGDGSVNSVDGILPDASKNVTLPAMTGASASAAGEAGKVPAPAAGDEGKFLRGDGAWADMPTASASTKGGVKIGAGLTMTDGVLSADVQSVPVMTGAGASAAGASGLVPAPAAGDNEKYLRGDGTWQENSGIEARDIRVNVSTSGWTKTGDFYKQTITSEMVDTNGSRTIQITADDSPIISLDLSDTAANAVAAQRAAFSQIVYAETAQNALILYAISAPTTPFILLLKVVG